MRLRLLLTAAGLSLVAALAGCTLGGPQIIGEYNGRRG